MLSILLFSFLMTNALGLRCYTCSGAYSCQRPIIEDCPSGTRCYYLESAFEQIIQRGCIAHCSYLTSTPDNCHMCDTNSCNLRRGSSIGEIDVGRSATVSGIGTGVEYDQDGVGKGTHFNVLRKSADRNDIGRGTNVDERTTSAHRDTNFDVRVHSAHKDGIGKGANVGVIAADAHKNGIGKGANVDSIATGVHKENIGEGINVKVETNSVNRKTADKRSYIGQSSSLHRRSEVYTWNLADRNKLHTIGQGISIN